MPNVTIFDLRTRPAAIAARGYDGRSPDRSTEEALDPLDEELTADQGGRRGPQCITCLWLNGPHPDARALAARVGQYTAASIWRAMRRRGFEGSQASVEKHTRERHA